MLNNTGSIAAHGITGCGFAGCLEPACPTAAENVVGIRVEDRMVVARDGFPLVTTALLDHMPDVRIHPEVLRVYDEWKAARMAVPT